MHLEVLYNFANNSLRQITDKELLVSNRTINGRKLWLEFLAMLPTEHRQENVCSSCERWFLRYANLLVIERLDDGTFLTRAAAWSLPTEHLPEFEKSIVRKMRELLEGSFPGHPVTREKPLLVDRHQGPLQQFTHFHCEKPLQTQDLGFKTAEQWYERRDRLNLFLSEISNETVMRATKLFRLDPELNGYLSQTRGVSSLVPLLQATTGKSNQERAAAVAWYSTFGFLYAMRSTVAGQFLTKLHSDGLPAAKGLFLTMVDPKTYMKPEAAPSEQQVEIATAIIEEMGAQNSLGFELASAKDPTIQWELQFEQPEETPVAEVEQKSVFADVKVHNPKPKPSVPPEDVIDVGVLSWSNALRLHLTGAKQVLVNIPHNRDALLGFLTAPIDRAAPSVLKHTVANPENVMSGMYFDRLIHPFYVGFTQAEKWVSVLGVIRPPEQLAFPINENEAWAFVVPGGDWAPEIIIPNPLPLESLIPELRAVHRVLHQHNKLKATVGKAGYACLLPIARAPGKKAYNQHFVYKVQTANGDWVKFTLALA